MDWKWLDRAGETVTREGPDFTPWFDIRLKHPDWPTEIVLSVVVDEDQGPIINGFRGGRDYMHGHQAVAKLLRESWNNEFLLRYVTAQAAGALLAKRVVDKHIDEIELTDETTQRIGDLREHFARRAYKATKPQRRRRLTRDLLKQVADTYRKAYEAGQPPTQAVAAEFQVSHSTAGRWVVEARKAGTLGPATGTKPGEATPSS